MGRFVLSALGVLFLAPALQAQEAASLPVEVHGFVSQGFIKTSANKYLGESKRGSFEFTEVGVNFTRALTDDLRVGVQLFARDLGRIGNYQPTFDWFYLDYHFRDWLGLRAGRTKLPFGLYNETSDVDAVRVPVLLPQSLYPIQQRDYLLAQTGGELYGNVPIGAAGMLEYRLYGGTIFLDSTFVSPNPSARVSVPYLFGGRLLWQPFDGLQVGATVQALRINTEFQATPEERAVLEATGYWPPEFSGGVKLDAPFFLWVASLEYRVKDLLLAAEYTRRSHRVETNLHAPQEVLDGATREGGYVMGSYQVRPWFTPGAYYSLFYPNREVRHGRDARQHDAALTMRFDLNHYWLLKLEGHFMRGTAGLDATLNERPLAELEKDWLVFLAKTTAYF